MYNKVWIEWAQINSDNDYIVTNNVHISDKTIIRSFDSNYVTNGYVLIRGDEDEVIDHLESQNNKFIDGTNDENVSKKQTIYENTDNMWKDFIQNNDINTTDFETKFETKFETDIKSNPAVGRYVDFTLNDAEISDGIGLQTQAQTKQKH